MWHPRSGIQYTCTAGTDSKESSEAGECPAAATLVTEVEVVGYFLTTVLNQLIWAMQGQI